MEEKKLIRKHLFIRIAVRGFLIIVIGIALHLGTKEVYSLTNSPELVARKNELIAMGVPGAVGVDQLYEEFDHVNGPNGTGGLDGLLLDGTPAKGNTNSTSNNNTSSNPPVITPSSKPKHEHVWNKEEVTKEPSCTELGDLTHYCDCGESYDEDIPFAEHDMEALEKVDSDCKTLGYTYFECTVCHEPLTIPSEEYGDHVYIPTEESYDATCEKDGKYIYKCQVCGDSYEEIKKSDGHDWNKEYTVDVKASCTSEGKKSIHCLSCDSIKEGSEIILPMKEHEEDENHVIIEPSLFKGGSEIIKCKECGSELELIELPPRANIRYIVISIAVGMTSIIVVVLLFVVMKRKLSDKHPIKAVTTWFRKNFIK